MLLRLLSLTSFLAAAALLLVVPFLVRGRGRKLAVVGCGLVAAGLFLLTEELQFQHRFDLLRARHLVQVAGWLEDYRQQAGHYPLAATGSVTVRLHDRPLPADAAVRDGGAEPVRTAAELEAELRRLLGEQVRLPVDPQRFRYAHLLAPNWYLYWAQDGDYRLDAWLFHRRDCTAAEGFGRYRLRLGTTADALGADQLAACLPAAAQ